MATELDPATLRWVGGDLAKLVAESEAFVEKYQHYWSPETRTAWRRVIIEQARLARRYRFRATRIENKRGKR